MQDGTTADDFRDPFDPAAKLPGRADAKVDAGEGDDEDIENAGKPDNSIEVWIVSDPEHYSKGRYRVFIPEDVDEKLELDAGKVQTPTLLLKGEFDPLAPMAAQAKFFGELGVSNKWFVVLAGGDHAALLESPRNAMLHAIDSFIQSQ